MDTNRYRQRLLEQQQLLSSRLAAKRVEARGTSAAPGDAGDESLDDERKEEAARDVDQDSVVLKEVRAALSRIDRGTFGRCVVDGDPIPESRLEALPWAAYCVKHQSELERHSETAPSL